MFYAVQDVSIINRQATLNLPCIEWARTNKCVRFFGGWMGGWVGKNILYTTQNRDHSILRHGKKNPLISLCRLDRTSSSSSSSSFGHFCVITLLGLRPPHLRARPRSTYKGGPPIHFFHHSSSEECPQRKSSLCRHHELHTLEDLLPVLPGGANPPPDAGYTK